jgi:Family of unknown function (DUF6459)
VTLNAGAGVGLLDNMATARKPATAGIKSATAGIAAEAPLPRIQVRPIPDMSPPVIDSRAAVFPELSPFIQGALAISFSGGGCDAVADPRDPQDPEDFGPQRTFSSDLPEPKAWVRYMAQALIEVMSGARPAPQVIRWTTPEVYSAVARRNAASARRTVIARRAIVRRVRICEPVDGVVEACAVVVDNGRVRALALRLIGVDRRWVVSALQVG